MKKKIFFVTIALLFVCLFVEIYLRFYWGFCDTVLMQEDEKFEYIAQPNQDRHRFRHHVYYNGLSMRSKPLKETERIRILGFGDSVINGGVQTDNESLATTLIEDSLTAKLNKNIRCLNISAGSWGPDNCYAYLSKYGSFNAEMILLVVSSHDAHDVMDFQKVVDSHVSFPSRQYPLAIAELLDRYLFPRIYKFLQKGKEKGEQDPIVKGTVFNPGFEEFYQYSLKNNIPLIVYLHPEKSEVVAREYNSQGKEIISFCEERNIPLIKELENGIDLSMFRDQIHINEKGQYHMMTLLIPEIEKRLQLNSCN